MAHCLRLGALVVGIALAGCTVAPSGGSAPGQQPQPQSQRAPQPVPAAGPRLSPSRAVNNFKTVVARVEPVAERECRARAPRSNCDFLIKVDTRDGQPVNAFQTLTRDGQPLIVFTVALIADARNADELAFVMSHEAAHHIEGHIPQMQQEAQLGAMAGGILASVLTTGASAAVRQSAIEQAVQAGAFVGSRQYSKAKELEADALGTVIAARAGYDPIRGAGFFTRLPDPGDKFLGSHPPNQDRIRTVQRVAAGL